MRLSSVANLENITVIDNPHGGRRVQIYFGTAKLTLSETEAVELATKLVDTLHQLRNPPKPGPANPREEQT